jgi:hypothetical protein
MRLSFLREEVQPDLALLYRVASRRTEFIPFSEPSNGMNPVLLGANMARCEQGYLCDICGQEVEAITDSDLYLRYVLGEVTPLALPKQRERHIRCHPATAQFIIDPAFDPPVRCDGVFDKKNLDPGFVRQEEARVTRGWRRLQQLPALGLPITEYPLPEVLRKWAKGEVRDS